MSDEAPKSPALRPPIELASIGEREVFDRYELCEELRERLGKTALLCATSDEVLVRLANAHFEPQAPTDPELFCRDVLLRLEVSAPSPPASCTRQFVRHVLGFSVLPAHKRHELVDEALRHMALLEELIAFYESLPAVQRLVKKGETPRDQEARMHVDFYRRCLDERGAISRYVTKGVDDEALRRSDEHYELRIGLGAFAEVPPYKFRAPRGEEHLDFRKINRWRHRVRSLPINRAHQLGAFYESGNLRAFYQELERDTPSVKLFAAIDYAIKTVPRVAARHAIFDELRELFDTKKWLGFYALALPQIEGLFAEMGEIAQPRGARSHAALPAKVRFIRDYAEIHEQSLDYFEYLLPFERNQFSHSGRIDEPALRALEVLFDLAFVCEIYTEITSPVIELLKLLANPEIKEKLDIRQWAIIFELVAKIVSSKQLPEVEAPFRMFLRESLPDNPTKMAITSALIEALPQFARHTREKMQTAARDRLGIDIDLGSARLNREAEHNTEPILALIDELDAIDETFLLLLDVRTVIEGLLSHGDLPAEARTRLKAALASETKTLVNLEKVTRR